MNVRNFLALACGGIVALVVYLGGAAIVLVAMHGIPLGATGAPPGRGDLVANLALGLVASVLGAILAMRLSRSPARVNALVLGLCLGAGAVAGFGKESSQWPGWFGVAMAATCMAGATGAVLIAPRRG